jgi:hypothetical protein
MKTQEEFEEACKALYESDGLSWEECGCKITVRLLVAKLMRVEGRDTKGMDQPQLNALEFMEANPEFCKNLDEMMADHLKNAERIDKCFAALRLIAKPKRPDGTFNLCREACQKLAEEALK